MSLLDEITTVGDAKADYKRDRWGRPLIVPDGGGKAKPYTRASSAAKAIEDTYGLELWARRNVAFGLAHDSSLVARILALGGSPSTWSKDDKQAATKVCDDAAGIAQAHKAADIGTAVHVMVERINRGETVAGGPYQADLDAYSQAVAEMAWTIDPELVECRMVCDELEMAGTCDIVPRLGDIYAIADLKTGASVEYGGLGYSAQLAAYANGDLYDPADDTRRRLDIDQSTGYIVHLPAGEGRCSIYAVDLTAGYRAAVLANEVRAIRKASKKFLTPITVAAPSAPSEVEQPPPEVVVPSPAPTSGGTPTPAEIHATLADPDEGGQADPRAMEALQRAYKALSDGPRTWIGRLTSEAQRSSVSFHTKDNQTVRRFEIVRGLVLLAEAGTVDDDDLRQLVAASGVGDAAMFPTIDLGHAVGAMSATEAALFAAMADDYMPPSAA